MEPPRMKKMASYIWGENKFYGKYNKIFYITEVCDQLVSHCEYTGCSKIQVIH